MDEAARNARNADRLAECFPVFAAKIRAVIATLEASGIRPRIQDAWRSPADQLAAFNSGHSKLKFGFHNVTGAAGAKEALAVDLLDDDAPLNPSKEYLLRLAAAARAQGLQSGILWGLPEELRKAVDQAIATGNFTAPVKVGWDPCHVEITGLTPEEARNTKRPS
jgi:hypothetical protein